MIKQARICRSVACVWAASGRSAVSRQQSSRAVCLTQPSRLILRPVPGRSRDKPRSYNALASIAIFTIQHKTYGRLIRPFREQARSHSGVHFAYRSAGRANGTRSYNGLASIAIFTIQHKTCGRLIRPFREQARSHSGVHFAYRSAGRANGARSYNGLASIAIFTIQHNTCGSELARESIPPSPQVLN